jgi:DNA mismatch repair ATPase MutS
MFETEVWFASRLLERSASRGPGLVLYDELFHSTNPPDGIATAQIFLEKLWRRSDVVSVVSTHVFEIVEAAPASVQRLCCQATPGTGDELLYGFSVEEGICRLSSVRSIWRRMGLAADTGKPENLVAKEK